MTQIFDRFFEEFAFGHVSIHLVFAEDFEDLAEMLLVFPFVLAIDEDVINVDNDTNIEKRFEDVLDQSLKCGWSIGESEWHDLVLIMTISSAESGFFDIILVDSDLMVTPAKIDFGEDGCALKSVEEVVDERDGESILFCDLVECPVVNAHS